VPEISRGSSGQPERTRPASITSRPHPESVQEMEGERMILRPLQGRDVYLQDEKCVGCQSAATPTGTRQPTARSKNARISKRLTIPIAMPRSNRVPPRMSNPPR
jgi:hypothetical protein